MQLTLGVYGGSAYSYANDLDFDGIGNEKFWQGVIDKFYEKYAGIAKYHIGLMRTVNETGRLVIPTGREYKFKTYPNYRGVPEWPRTQILNYPVQGFSADLMTLARIAAYRRIKALGVDDRVKFIATVHDDIELDVDNDPELVYNISIILEKVFEDIPSLYERYFKQEFNVPMAGEVSVGNNLMDMVTFNPDSFRDDFKWFMYCKDKNANSSN